MPKTIMTRSALVAFACSLSLSAYAMADGAKRAINIPSGDLSAAIELLAKQAGADIVYRPEQVRGLKTRGFNGEFSLEEAVSKLLEGTPLTLSTDSSGAMLIATPLPRGPAPTRKSSTDDNKTTRPVEEAPTAGGGAKQSFWDRLRLAQADQGKTSSDASVSSNTSIKKEEEERASQKQPGPLEEVIVTARKREENLQRTPVAVTALSETALLQAQVADVSDLQRTAPGLVVARGGPGSGSFAYVAIRGQGNLQPILANDPAVATYIDGVYISRPSQGLTDLLDLQRVEVLRGPQGTLFGRNTTGGAINILTKDPVGTFGAEVSALGGNSATRAANAMLNIPVTDKLAGRVSYSYRKRDGYGHNRALNRDAWDLTSHFARAKLKYTSGNISVTLSGDYNKQESMGQLVGLSAVNAAIFRGGLAAFLPAMTASLHNTSAWWDTYGGGLVTPATAGSLNPAVLPLYRKLPFNALDVWGVGATISIDLGRLNLKSITGYRYAHNAGLVDTDASPAPVLATFAGSISRAVSEEIQLSGNILTNLSFITGGYYGDETGSEYSRSQIFGGPLRDSNADAENGTKGLFAQFYYQITPALRAVAGYRDTWDNRDSVLHNGQIYGLPYNVAVAGSPTGINCTVSTPDAPPTATSCNQTQTAKFEYPAWTGGLDWQAMEDLFVYIKTSGAAKAGGWNLRAGGLPAFAPEKVRDVEGGFKSDFLDGRLRTNVAAFHIWKTNNQALVNAVVPGIGVTQYIQNNGEARIWGAEFEVMAAPWKGMEIDANLSLQDGEYEKGTYKETQTVASASALPGCTTASRTTQLCAVDLSDLPLIQLPKTQFNIGATQRFPVAGGTVSVHGDYGYISSQQFNTVKPAAQQSAAVKAQYGIENTLGRIPGYGVFNARIAYDFANPDLEFAFMVRNIADKKYLIRSFSDLYRQLGFAIEFPGEPRLYSIEAKYKF